MGMSDQYDDGRYDAGHIEMPGGWCVPADQCPEPIIVPTTARRGGIQYPKRTQKGTHMTRMTKAQIEHELRLNAELQDTLRQRRLQLQQEAKTAIPAEPRTFTMFTVTVKFSMRGKSYQFLILRCGEKYFTTGTTDKSKVFNNWEALVGWLEGPDIYSHTDIEILKSAEKVVSFDTGAIEKLLTGQPPF